MEFKALKPLSVCCLLLVLICGCRTSTEDSQKTKPAAKWNPFNIVVVTVDTLRPDHLGCYGHTGIKTPHLDRLAEKGTLFENAVCQVPITPPSHASMFTGTYPGVHQVRNVAGFNLDPSHRTLATDASRKRLADSCFCRSGGSGKDNRLESRVSDL